MKDVYLLSAIRTPFAKAGTALKNVHAAEMGRFALAELLSKNGLLKKAELINEVIVGNTGCPSDTANIARVIALRAGLPLSVSAYTVHRNCASGLEALAQAALKAGSGQGQLFAAGGTESMSQMPLMYNQKAVAFFEKLSRARRPLDKAKTLAQLPLAEFLKPRIGIVEGLMDPFCGLNMGQTAEVLAKEFKISRETQDAFALESHKRALKAQKSGLFKDEIAVMPLAPDYKELLEADVGPREGQSLEALAKLKPYFDRKHGTVTVGNACPITDGSAMALIGSEESLSLTGIKPLAKIRSWAFAGLDPKRMGLGPAYAAAKALDIAGLKLKDMGVIEINEAFAAQVLACLELMASKKLCEEHLGLSEAMGEIDPSKLNPNGGAIALGHPVGSSGARIVLTAALEMRRRGESFALASLCIGGGQGGAMVLEAI